MIASSSATPAAGLMFRLGRIGAALARFVPFRSRQRRRYSKASAHCEGCPTLPEVYASAVDTRVPAELLQDSKRAFLPRLHTLLVWAWVASLLVVVGYALIEGERALTQLDTLKALAAYSTGVRRMVRPEPVTPAKEAQARQSASATRVP